MLRPMAHELLRAMSGSVALIWPGGMLMSIDGLCYPPKPIMDVPEAMLMFMGTGEPASPLLGHHYKALIS